MFDKTGCEKKFLARVVSDQFRCSTDVIKSFSEVSHDFAAVFSSHSFIACAIRCYGTASTCTFLRQLYASFDDAHSVFSERVFQVDSLIEAFYHLDESVKGEFLGMQMSKVRVLL